MRAVAAGQTIARGLNRPAVACRAAAAPRWLVVRAGGGAQPVSLAKPLAPVSGLRKGAPSLAACRHFSTGAPTEELLEGLIVELKVGGKSVLPGKLKAAAETAGLEVTDEECEAALAAAAPASEDAAKEEESRCAPPLELRQQL